jgi:hypothetical protein
MRKTTGTTGLSYCEEIVEKLPPNSPGESGRRNPPRRVGAKRTVRLVRNRLNFPRLIGGARTMPGHGLWTSL